MTRADGVALEMNAAPKGQWAVAAASELDAAFAVASGDGKRTALATDLNV